MNRLSGRLPKSPSGHLHCCEHIHRCLQPAVAGYTAAVVEHLYRCFGHADIHALANQVVGNRILVPAVRNKVVVARSAGTLKKVLESYKKKDLLILDEWLIRPLSPQESYEIGRAHV